MLVSLSLSIRNCRLRLRGTRRVEVGKKVTLQGTYTNPNIEYSSDAKVVQEWVLPDGSVKQGGLLDTVLTEDMLDERGVCNVYVSGLHAGGKRQNHSKTENQRKILGIQIPGATPEYKTEIHHDTFGTHRISLWCGCSYPGVVFSQDWQYDKNVMTLSSDNNGTKVFQVTKSGTHTLTYVLKDNRNNEARVDYTFIVNEQSPMEISVTPKYSNKFMRAPLDLSLRSSVSWPTRQTQLTM